MAREELVQQLERRAARLQHAAAAIALGLAAWAVASELRRPPGDRCWHGRLAGLIPYDLRPPTAARIRRTWWSPEDSRLLVGTAFGVGWDLNLGRLARLLRTAASS